MTFFWGETTITMKNFDFIMDLIIAKKIFGESIGNSQYSYSKKNAAKNEKYFLNQPTPLKILRNFYW